MIWTVIEATSGVVMGICSIIGVWLSWRRTTKLKVRTERLERLL